MDDKKKNPSLEIELKESVAEGVYSNMSLIAHSSSEFVLDFISLLPGVNKAQVRSRVIMAPEHAKRLMLILRDNINRYETNFGEIEIKKAEIFPPIGKIKTKGDA
ncbi:MAG: DUF3467 domain-containing protein [Bacteroidales bacterium]|nr:DUF3467 domain-containing protein [Bacteroidales bacterium]